jgi:hypothetical protein
MSTKKREVIFGGRIMGARIRAHAARQRAQEAAQQADRAECEAWSIQWKPSAARPNRRRRLPNASTAVWVG